MNNLVHTKCTYSKMSCAFCHRGDSKDDIKVCGQLTRVGECCAHLRCKQYSAKLIQYKFEHNDGFKIDKVNEEINRGKKLVCFICKNKKGKLKPTLSIKGATAGCAYMKCKRSFHYPCAAQDTEAITKRHVFEKNGKNIVLYRVYCGEEHEKKAEPYLERDLGGHDVDSSSEESENESNDLDQDDTPNESDYSSSLEAMPVHSKTSGDDTDSTVNGSNTSSESDDGVDTPVPKKTMGTHPKSNSKRRRKDSDSDWDENQDQINSKMKRKQKPSKSPSNKPQESSMAKKRKVAPESDTTPPVTRIRANKCTPGTSGSHKNAVESGSDSDSESDDLQNSTSRMTRKRGNRSQSKSVYSASKSSKTKKSTDISDSQSNSESDDDQHNSTSASTRNRGGRSQSKNENQKSKSSGKKKSTATDILNSKSKLDDDQQNSVPPKTIYRGGRSPLKNVNQASTSSKKKKNTKILDADRNSESDDGDSSDSDRNQNDAIPQPSTSSGSVPSVKRRLFLPEPQKQLAPEQFALCFVKDEAHSEDKVEVDVWPFPVDFFINQRQRHIIKKKIAEAFCTGSNQKRISLKKKVMGCHDLLYQKCSVISVKIPKYEMTSVPNDLVINSSYDSEKQKKEFQAREADGYKDFLSDKCGDNCTIFKLPDQEVLAWKPKENCSNPVYNLYTHFQEKTIQEEKDVNSQDTSKILFLGPVDNEILNVVNYYQKVFPTFIEQNATMDSDLWCVVDLVQIPEDTQNDLLLQELLHLDSPKLAHNRIEMFTCLDPSVNTLSCLVIHAEVRQGE